MSCFDGQDINWKHLFCANHVPHDVCEVLNSVNISVMILIGTIFIENVHFAQIMDSMICAKWHVQIDQYIGIF